MCDGQGCGQGKGASPLRVEWQQPALNGSHSSAGDAHMRAEARSAHENTQRAQAAAMWNEAGARLAKWRATIGAGNIVVIIAAVACCHRCRAWMPPAPPHAGAACVASPNRQQSLGLLDCCLLRRGVRQMLSGRLRPKASKPPQRARRNPYGAQPQHSHPSSPQTTVRLANRR